MSLATDLHVADSPMRFFVYRKMLRYTNIVNLSRPPRQASRKAGRVFRISNTLRAHGYAHCNTTTPRGDGGTCKGTCGHSGFYSGAAGVDAERYRARRRDAGCNRAALPAHPGGARLRD